jgi:predicted HAD superfamily Cof-like phosphohydrolase
MNAFGQEVKETPEFPDEATQALRVELIEEELGELKEAIEAKNYIAVADALTDILYVTYGAGHAFGIDLDKCFAEVQRSNMSKLGADGKPIYREDGKVLKGPNYSEPDLFKALQQDFILGRAKKIAENSDETN